MAIVQTVDTIKHLYAPLELLAPDIYRFIRPLMHGKLNAIQQLLEAISGDSPKLVSASYEQLQEAMSSGDKHWFMNRAMDRKHKRPLLKIEPIPNLSMIPANKNDVIRSYLDARNPKAVLLELEELAHDLRRAISENFSIQDILLNVGDDRFAVLGTFIGV